MDLLPIGKVGKNYILPSSVKPTKDQREKVDKLKKEHNKVVREQKKAQEKVIKEKQKEVAELNKQYNKMIKEQKTAQDTRTKQLKKMEDKIIKEKQKKEKKQSMKDKNEAHKWIDTLHNKGKLSGDAWQFYEDRIR